MFSNVSPVTQDFIWVAEYTDKTNLTEFDYTTKEKVDFYSIDRSRLLSFGLLGHGMTFMFDVVGGTLKLHDKKIDLVYINQSGKRYSLTSNNKIFNDIITYKDAETLINFSNGARPVSGITQYNFGYKTKLCFDDLDFNFKVIVKIPLNKPVNIDLTLVSNRDVKGKLAILKNGTNLDEIPLELLRNLGREVNWTLR
jgi:hypothetical protein